MGRVIRWSPPIPCKSWPPGWSHSPGIRRYTIHIKPKVREVRKILDSKVPEGIWWYGTVARGGFFVCFFFCSSVFFSQTAFFLGCGNHTHWIIDVQVGNFYNPLQLVVNSSVSPSMLRFGHSNPGRIWKQKHRGAIFKLLHRIHWNQRRKPLLFKWSTLRFANFFDEGLENWGVLCEIQDRLVRAR